MSLVQHLSAIDGVDREPEADEGDDYISIRRKISYDVLQPPNEGIPVAELRPGSLAYDHSPTKRISMFHLLSRRAPANNFQSRSS